MRKKLWVTGLLVAVGLAAVLMWPRPRDEEADGLYQATLARIDAHNQTKENGLLELEPLWEGQTLQDPGPCPVANYGGDYETTLARLAADPDGFARAAADFREQTLPRLRAAVARPLIAFPLELDYPEPRGLSAPRDGKLEMRNLTMALGTMALHCFSTGQRQEGLDYLVLAYGFVARQSIDTDLVGGMMRVACVSLLTQTTLEILEHVRLEPDELERLASAMTDEVLPPRGYGRIMDIDYCLYRYRMEHPGEAGGGFLGELYMGHNAAVMTEFYLKHRVDYDDLHRSLTQSEVEQEVTARWLAHLVQVTVINCFRSRDIYRMALNQLEATRAVLAIKLYQTSHGALPVDLTSLEREPVDWVGGKFIYRRVDGGFELSSSSPVYSASGWPDPMVFYPYRLAADGH